MHSTAQLLTGPLHSSVVAVSRASGHPEQAEIAEKYYGQPSEKALAAHAQTGRRIAERHWVLARDTDDVDRYVEGRTRLEAGAKKAAA